MSNSPSDFYIGEYADGIADRWDEFIDWSNRTQAEGSFFVNLLSSAGVNTVFDVACGTGFHTVSLAKAGFDVAASDGSEAMLRVAATALRTHCVSAPLILADWRELGRHITRTFDAIVCLGNAFTHLLTAADRKAAISQFAQRLRPGGLLVIDSRNYDRILDRGYSFSHRVYYCGKSVGGAPEVLRADRIVFRYDFADGVSKRLTVYPIRQAEMSSLLVSNGFEKIETFGDFRPITDLYEPDFLIHVATLGV